MNPSSPEIAKVIVIGGGFAGLNVVKGLKKAPVDITLVDRRNHHVFQPLLYQVATAELEPASIGAPIRSILSEQQNATVGLAEVQGVDLARKVILLPRGEIAYDYLVIATGVQQSYFGHDEYRPLAPGLKTMDDALEIRRRLLLAFEAAEWEGDAAARRAKLTFVIVGGGPTGVELSGAIMDVATRSLPKEFRHIDTTTARVILVQGAERLLPAMPEDLSAKVWRDLEAAGVEVRLHSYVTEVTEDGVRVGDEHIAASNVFWAAGVRGQLLAETLGVELDRAGRVVVGPDLSIVGYPEVFVIGDAAHAIDAKTGEPVPGVAQGAIQTGKFVAEIIGRDLRGVAPAERPAFSYFDKGSMAMVGRGKAVASVGRLHLSGFLGWMSWIFLHVMFLVGFRRKFVTMTEWVRSYLFGQRYARLIMGDQQLDVKDVVKGTLTED
ncbi:MAG: NAD(P)/FAD-dependent oxidoreductase [Chloroflexota bacterium]|nr:NAD(P)/FAD-dependent oxidoreductase [Chloroflexota bacterium]